MRSGRNSVENFVISIEEIDEDQSPNASKPENYDASLPHTENSLVPWIIPRPTLVKTENTNEETTENLFQHQGITYPQNLVLALPSSSTKDHTSSSATSSTSKASTKSANSNTLLLTAANLAKFTFENNPPHHGYLSSHQRNHDTESLASSTHFTLVNGMERKLPKHMKPVKCCCERHQLTILITTMTMFLAFTIFFCIYIVHAKAQSQGRLS